MSQKQPRTTDLGAITLVDLSAAIDAMQPGDVINATLLPGPREHALPESWIPNRLEARLRALALETHGGRCLVARIRPGARFRLRMIKRWRGG
jgi:hypothetical protein